MIRSLLIIILISLCTRMAVSQQPEITENESLALLCKTWGFLKYYHPQVNQGQMDWDSVLISQMPAFEKAKGRKGLNEVIKKLILLPNPDLEISKNVPKQDEYNDALAWIQSDNVLSFESKGLFTTLIENFDSDSLYYATSDEINVPFFNNERPYSDMVFPDKPYRLLALFRAWNAVNYFFAYKDLMTKSMDFVLKECLKDAIVAQDTLSYHFMLRKFAHYLEDNHANMSTSPYFLGLHSNTVGASLRYMKGKFVFSEVYGEYKKYLQPGDVLDSIDDRPIKALVDSLSNYYSGSNEVSLYGSMNYSLLSSYSTFTKLSMVRGDSILSVTVPKKPFSEIEYPEELTYKIFDDKIFYFKSRPYSPEEFDSLMEIAFSKEAIIVDLRYGFALDWPRFGDHLYGEEKAFAQIEAQNFKEPGSFKRVEPVKYAKSDNGIKTYEGKVVVLTDEFVQSLSEYAVLFLKQYPRCTVIGTTTAGANGNVARVPLPGGFRLGFSSVCILTPDGSQTQKVGVAPDIEVKRTIKGLRNGKDEVLAYALNFLLAKDK